MKAPCATQLRKSQTPMAHTLQLSVHARRLVTDGRAARFGDGSPGGASNQSLLSRAYVSSALMDILRRDTPRAARCKDGLVPRQRASCKLPRQLGKRPQLIEAPPKTNPRRYGSAAPRTMLAPLVAAAASFACDPPQRMRTTPSASSFRGNTLLIRVRAPPRMMCANPEPAERQPANTPPSSPSAMPLADTSPGEVVCDDDGCYLMLDTVSDGLVDTAIPV